MLTYHKDLCQAAVLLCISAVLRYFSLNQLMIIRVQKGYQNMIVLPMHCEQTMVQLNLKKCRKSSLENQLDEKQRFALANILHLFIEVLINIM